MTSNTKQLRAAILAALMVMSVFAGTVAFAGSAAAVDGASVDFFNPTTADEDTTTTHDINVSFTNHANDAGTDYINLSLPSGVTLDSSSLVVQNDSGATIATAADGETNISFDNASAENAGTVYLNGSITIATPSVDSDTNGDVTFNFADSDDTSASATQQVTIENTDASEAGAPEYLEATHYDNDTASDSTDPELEIAFSEPVTLDSKDDVRIYADEERIPNGDITLTDATSTSRVVLTLDQVYTGEMEVYLTNGIEDTGGTALASDSRGNQTADVAPVPVKGGEDINAYRGSEVAVIADSTGDDITVEASDEEDFSYFQAGSTGTNSQVYVFNTDNRDIGQYNISIEGESDATVNVRDLGLAVDIDDLTVTTDDEIEGTVEANAGNRPVEIALLDSDGDEVDDGVIGAQLTGQADYDFTFNASDLDLDSGNYTVEVTDNQSGVTAESSSIQVDEAGEGRADFGGEGIITEQRGDVANITITLENSDYATLTYGSDEVGFLGNVTVEDANGDGQVNLLLNTYAATGANSLQDDGSPIFDVPDLEDDNDEIESAEITQDVDSLLEAGEYDLEVRAGQSEDEDSQNVATLVLEERNTSSINTWTAPSGADYEDFAELEEAVGNNNLTQSDSIADGDIAVHQLQASGLEGILGAQEGEEVTSEFFGSEMTSVSDFTVEQANPGANQDPYEVLLGPNNATVWADGENDTYYIMFDTDTNGLNVDGASEIDDGDTLEANFTVYEDEGNLTDVEDGETVTAQYDIVEAEYTVDEPVNVSASGSQTIEGETTVAPGTELSLRVRSSGDTQPSFLKTSNVYVTENGTFSGTFDFSEQEVGDEFTLTVSGSPAGSDEFDGNVVEAVETDTETGTVTDDGETETDTPTEDGDTPTDTETPTEGGDTPTDTETEPGTETGGESGTQTPGFGVVVALTALLAAALLAVRRD